MSKLKCTECGQIESESCMKSEQVWNPDYRRHENFMLCPHCVSKEGGFEIANECEDCGELDVLVDGTDLCIACNHIQERLDRNLERGMARLENEHHERKQGVA